jgi:hypothetical protein
MRVVRWDEREQKKEEAGLDLAKGNISEEQ